MDIHANRKFHCIWLKGIDIIYPESSEQVADIED